MSIQILLERAHRHFLPMLLIALLLTACPALVFAEETISATFDAIEDTEFGAVSLGCSLDEFLQTGFHLGDSCDVELSNGFRLEDVPVYDGYYVRTDSPLIVLYPGYAHPGFTYSTTGDMWKSSGAKAGDTVTVTLREIGKYAGTQNALSAVCSNDQNDYVSDAVFAIFVNSPAESSVPVCSFAARALWMIGICAPLPHML